MSFMLGLKRTAKKILKPSSVRPLLGSKPCGGPEDSPITFVMVCRQGFDVNKPNANLMIRMGFCHGFALIGVRYQLVSVWDLEDLLPQLKNPVVFLSSYDYLDISRKTCKLLRKYPHFVWGMPDHEIIKRAYEKFDVSPYSLPDSIYKRVAESEPNFIMAPVPESALQFYSTWLKYCSRIESIPLACDTTRYFRDNENQENEGIKMAFVGGYWEKKAFQFDKYLKPYETILQVYGYNKWPYKGYKGLLPKEDEHKLYQNARLSPAISEPHAEFMGDIVERVFKIMGSGGLAITDVVPFYRELFEPDELLVPRSLEEYHYMVKKTLDDDNFNMNYREKGYKAIMEKHTYVHRARSILNYLDIDWKSG